MRKVAAICVSLLMITGSAFASAETIDVKANWEYWRYNYDPVPFAAGTYTVKPIGVADGGQYNAWNAWGAGEVGGCDATGLCSRGYLNSYSFGFVGENDYVTEIATVGGSVVAGTALAYQTPILALTNAESYVFSLTQAENLYFYLRDGENWYYDNVGGISLSIQTIAEPNTYLLMMIGLAAIGVVAGRRGIFENNGVNALTLA